MAKSYNQYLKRLKRRHNIWSTYGQPCVYTEKGSVLFNLKQGDIIDLRSFKQPLSLAVKPSEFGIRELDRIEGTRFYVESYIKEFNNLEIRILTRVGWAH